MALFKVTRGNRTNLPSTMTDGWAYFCTDTGEFFIDWANENGNLQRGQINADEAKSVIEYNNNFDQKFWRGTKAEYDAIEVKDDSALYIVMDEDVGDDDSLVYMLSYIYDPQGRKTDIFSYVDNKISSIPAPDVSAQIGTHNTSLDSHLDIRENIKDHVENKNNPHVVTTGQIGAVPISRKVNGKELSEDISIAASDVGAPTVEEMKNAIVTSLPTYTEKIMLASSWVDDTYSFESEYPHDNYNIGIEVAPTATTKQFEAFGEAMICGSASSNVATAINGAPRIDIPIIVKVVGK